MEFDPKFEAEVDARFAAEVRAALRRVDAPAGFAQRVMARSRQLADVSAERAARDTSPAPRRRWLALSAWRSAPAWRSAAAAAALLAITGGAVRFEQVREQRRADAAAAQFNEAMQVTDRALDHATAQLEHTQFAVVARMLQQNGGKQ